MAQGHGAPPFRASLRQDVRAKSGGLGGQDGQQGCPGHPQDSGESQSGKQQHIAARPLPAGWGRAGGSCLALEFMGQGSSPCKVPCSPVSGTAFGWGLGARRGLWACKVPTPSPPLPSLLVLFPYSSQAHAGSHANFLKGRSLLLSAFIFFRYLTSYHTLSRLK